MERVCTKSNNSVGRDEVAKTTISVHEDDDEAERTTAESQLSDRAIAFSIDSLLCDLPPTRPVCTATSSGMNYSFILTLAYGL